MNLIERFVRYMAWRSDRPMMVEHIKKLEDAYRKPPFVKMQHVEDKIAKLKKEWKVT